MRYCLIDNAPRLFLSLKSGKKITVIVIGNIGERLTNHLSVFEWGGPQEHFDKIKRLITASNKDIRGDWGSQKHTFIRKKLGFWAKGRKIGYSDNHQKAENIIYLKNLR